MKPLNKSTENTLERKCRRCEMPVLDGDKICAFCGRRLVSRRSAGVLGGMFALQLTYYIASYNQKISLIDVIVVVGMFVGILWFGYRFGRDRS